VNHASKTAHHLWLGTATRSAMRRWVTWLPKVAVAMAPLACVSTAVHGDGGGMFSGGPTTGGTGGCYVDGISDEFDPCGPTGECGCPLHCVTDPLARAITQSQTVDDHVCEAPCQTNADCASIYAACVDGLCGTVACGGDGGNGLYNSVCLMGSGPSSTGTCEIVPLAEGRSVALCVEAGDADGGCDPHVSLRSQSASLCPAGLSCVDINVSKPVCRQLCDDEFVSCSAGMCVLSGTTPASGVCL
jgi:hypothetical protein